MSFAADVARFVEKTGIKGNVVFRRIALDALGGVIADSPVLSGRFKGNWNVALNDIDKSTTESVDPGGAHTEAMGQASIARANLNDEIYISNNLPYAERLEYGYSSKAPAGMVRKNVAAIQAEFAAMTVVEV